ncbi:MAG TPA: hypothetical protein PKA37_18425, partial [Planctomycetota bacterium]|nr:hypothetical protein [Planctomycetota bacterium]
PLAGFSGPKLIEAGVPFRFSTKYGTRLFVVPAGIRPPPCEYPLPEIYSTWPSLPVPIAEHHSVSQWSRVARELTTLQLVGLKEGVPEIKVIRTQSFDEAGNPIHGVPLFWVLSGVCTVGVLLLLCFLRKRTRVSRNPTPGPLP